MQPQGIEPISEANETIEALKQEKEQIADELRLLKQQQNETTEAHKRTLAGYEKV